MKYSDFSLHFRPGEVQQTYQVTACSAAGTATGLFRIPAALQEGGKLLKELQQALPDRTQDRRHTPAEQAGTELFLALFHEPVLRLLDFETSRPENRAYPGLNLRLHFAVEGQDLARLDSLPWELLLDPRTDFPVVRRTFPIVRSIAAPRLVRPLALSVPLRVLAVTSQPSDLTPLDLNRELSSLQREPKIEVTVLETPTPHELRHLLQEESFQVLHFMGHGTFAARNGQDSPAGDPLQDEELALLARNTSDLRMVVLDRCDSGRARSGEVNPFSGVATELVKRGIPAVVALHSPISDRAALTFSRTFYEHLAAGDPPEAAAGAGRSAIVQEDPQEWATVSLYLPISSEGLSDKESQRRDRYAELVDKKFRSLLTETEQAELLQLQKHLDEVDSKFYEPIEKKLEIALAKLRQRSQAR
jgi:hypothetical protein